MVSGDFQMNKLEFPAAYTSYMQITLAARPARRRRHHRVVRGEISVRDNAPTSLHVMPESLVFHDKKDRMHIAKINGDIYWTPAGVDAPYSTLTLGRGRRVSDFPAARRRSEFVAHGTNFALMQPTKLPILDGALAIDTLSMGNLGASDMESRFKGAVRAHQHDAPGEGIRLAGVPGNAGGAAFPRVKLKDNLLTIEGNVESQVFGGRVVGSNIRIQDPLGRFPAVLRRCPRARSRPGLVTKTFEVGSITGRLEADVLNLELFAWSPVAFDARVATPKGDKSRHRISAKAVSSLSNVGGGGGGVVQALQSGVLRFFDDYSYDKLGITCRLRNDVCQMSGVEPAGIGYYIVKGAGLPRIDIVGNAGRVRWSQLLASIPTDTSNITVQ